MTFAELRECNSRSKLGVYGEKLIAALLGGKIVHKLNSGDIFSPEFGYIEVKTAIVSSCRNSRVVRFCISKNDKHGKTCCDKAQFIAFVVCSIYGDRVYLVPRSLVTQKHICMSPETFNRRFAQFKIN